MHKNEQANNTIFLYAIPAVIIFIILYLISGTPYKDDSYIFYRYASNWAAGYGPVYNVGEYVEGYSSFLWMAILALGPSLSIEPDKLAISMNLFIGVACLFLTSHISGFIGFSRPRLMAFILPLFVALSHGFYFYGATGMDTLIFALVILLCIISLYKSKNTGNYLFVIPSLVLLNIVRAEGFVYSFALLATLAYMVLSEKNNTTKKQLCVSVGAFISITMLLFIARYNVYNEWMPATVSAKGFAAHSLKEAYLTGSIEALKDFIGVIKQGVKYQTPLLLILLVPVFVLISRKDKDSRLMFLIAACLAVNIFVMAWAGGDWMPFKRFIIPMLPVLIIFAAWAIDVLFCRYWGEALNKKVAVSIALILVLTLWISFFIRPTIKAEKYTESGRSLYLRHLGVFLHDMNIPIILLTDIAGKLPYYAGPLVYTRDIFGLTDIHNAKYGDVWSVGCGRTDFTYSFATPFDMFAYNSLNIHKRFISFCQGNSTVCEKYRFLKSDHWNRENLFIITNINHPVSTALIEEFSAVPLPVNDDLKNII